MRILPILTIVIIIISSCEDQIRVPEFGEAASMKIINSSEGSFFRADELENAEITFSLYSANLSNISTVQIFAELYDNEVDSITYKRTEIYNFIPKDFDNEGFLNDIRVTTYDLINAFDLEYADDFSAGDILTFYNVVTMIDGRVYPDSALNNVNTDNKLNIDNTSFYLGSTSSFSPGFNAYIACPSNPEDWEGKYQLSLNVQSSCALLDCNASVEATVTQSTEQAPFQYFTTSHDAGLWLRFDPSAGLRSGTFFDLCGTPVLQPSSTGYGNHEGVDGSYRDEDSGIIYMEWCNFLNPICGVSIFEPIE